MEQIVAALISAVASVLVALIGRKTSTESADGAASSNVRSASKANRVPSGKRPWTVMLFILVPWILVTPPLIHWDFVGVNMFVIVVVTLITSAIWPIRPLGAAAIVLGLHPLNFLMEPVAKGMRGMSMAGRFETSKVVLLLSIFLGNAAIAAGLCAWRTKKVAVTAISDRQMEQSMDIESQRPPDIESHKAPSGSLVHDLERLTALHTQGQLSDEEFLKAKQRLLSS